MTDLPLPPRDGADVEHVRTVPADTRGFSASTRARVRAVDVLFEADSRGLSVNQIADERTRLSTAQTTLPERSRALAVLFAAHADAVDDQLRMHSETWQLERMPTADRAILRLGIAELLFSDQNPPSAVLIKEYTDVAEALSTDGSARFVNALLQRVADMKDLLQ